MHGKNKITHPEYRPDGALRVKEVFYTIQGEGPRAGQPAVFVRLAGCNLRCFFCDTNFEGGELLTVDEVHDRIERADPDQRTRLIVITGGEPLAQQILPLIYKLGSFGWTCQIETAGTCFPPDTEEAEAYELYVAGIMEIVCSPKTAKLNARVIEYCEAFKYIVRDGEVDPMDGLPTNGTQASGAGGAPCRPPDGATVYLQPMDEGDMLKDAQNARVAADACTRHGYRLSLQQHKIVGLP